MSIEAVLDPESEQVGEGMAGVIDLIGDDMDGEAEGESPGPGAPDKDKRRQPDDKGDLVGMEEEEEPVVFMVFRRPEEFLYPGEVDPELEKVFEEVVEIDENPRCETGDRRRGRTGDKIDPRREENRYQGMVPYLHIIGSLSFSMGGNLIFN